jgi:hypothetical protein
MTISLVSPTSLLEKVLSLPHIQCCLWKTSTNRRSPGWGTGSLPNAQRRKLSLRKGNGFAWVSGSMEA